MKHFASVRLRRRLLRGTAALLVCCCMLGSFPWTTMPAYAATQVELQAQLEEYEKKLTEDKKALAAMQSNTAQAKQKKANLESQISTLKSQISVLSQSISEVQNDIGQTEQSISSMKSEISTTQSEISQKEDEISAKEDEIDQKQADIDSQWDDFKSRMAAMQEMHDSGTLAMFSSVQNLYQLLTFSEMLQDISAKDTEILDNMKTEKEELETAKTELETAKTDLESTKSKLESKQSALEAQQSALESKQQTLQSQQATMESKQNELADDLTQAGTNLQDAQSAQAEAQQVLDSDQMNYEAVYSQIQALVTSAEGTHSDLAFDGSFLCPLASYTRISSYYGYRTLGGVTKLHPGVDYAAPAGTPLRAAASGYVTAAGWNSGGYGYYVLIYHGSMSDGNTYSTLYAHMKSAPSVSAGQQVSQGQTIGYVGSTGNSTGNHLHLELWQGSNINNSVSNKAKRVNPLSYIG